MDKNLVMGFLVLAGCLDMTGGPEGDRTPYP